jgi:hypothetical protein
VRAGLESELVEIWHKWNKEKSGVKYDFQDWVHDCEEGSFSELENVKEMVV